MDETSDEIESITRKYIKKILALNPKAVLCVGEYSFVYAVVTELLKHNIPTFCVKSEFEIDNSNNNRTINFRFIDFITYKKMETCNFQILINKNNILLNCSNLYPSKDWDNSAISAAKKYGVVIDEPIEPVFDDEKIFANIEKILNRNPKTVLLDGEFYNFYTMASALKKCGCDIICKCSKRVVKEERIADKTSKTTQYKFLCFREIKAIGE